MKPAQTRVGRVLSGIGGLYTVESDGKQYKCFAKGVFRHDEINVLAGDFAEFDGSSCDGSGKREDIGYIKKILPRKNHLLRPPVSNIDRLFLVFSFLNPSPTLLAVDKLTALAAHNGIEAVIVFTKKDIAPKEVRDTLLNLYRNSGFTVLELCAQDREETQEKLSPFIKGATSVFTGPSGVGKSTIINTLYPGLGARSGEISRKNLRGRNTTRQSLLYRVEEDGTYLADTPGFTLLDFERFFFMKKEELVYAFGEYREYIGSCKYTKCTHTKEEGCKILEALQNGALEQSRHESYLSLYEDLKKHKDWENNGQVL